MPKAKNVGLADCGVVASEHIGDADVAVIRVLVAGGKVEAWLLLPITLLAVLVQVAKDAELENVVLDHLGDVIRDHDGVAGGCPARREHARIDVAVTAVQDGGEIMGVRRRVDIAEAVADGALVIQRLVSTGGNVDKLVEVQPAHRNLIG